MPDEPKPNLTADEKKALLAQMKKEAERVERRMGAEACIVICMFKDGDHQISVQDAGKFPMPPEQFYNVMIQTHRNGQMDHMRSRPKPTKLN